MDRLVTLLLLALACAPAAAQALVHEWDFGDGVGTWTAAHGVGPLSVEDGALVVTVTGDDPYVHSSTGNDLHLDVDPSEFIRIRLRSNITGLAEFFWAENGEGGDGGFVAGKEIGFQVRGDDAWQELDVHPDWRGHIVRLRLDPPGDEAGDETRVSRIAIYDWGTSPQHGPSWDLTRDHGNWLPRGTTRMEPTPGGLELSGATPEVATTIGTAPPATGWLTLEARPSAPGRVLYRWTDAAGAHHQVIRRLDAGRSRQVMCFADGGAPVAAGRQLDVKFLFDHPSEVLLSHVTIGPTPSGSALLSIAGAHLDRACAVAQEPVRLRVELENDGGETLPAGSLPVRSAAGGLDTAIDHRALKPGQRTSVQTTLRLAAAPQVAIAVGPPADAHVLTLSVSEAPADAPKPGASVTGDTAALVGDAIRLRAGRAGEDVYGPLWLELKDGDAWRRVATLRAVGRVMSGPDDEVDAAPATAADGALTFRTELKDAVGKPAWRLSATYRLAGPDRIAVEHRLTALANGEVFHFGGPWVRVGDGTTGAARFEGLFPGLEYLGTDVQSDERSSSDRDVAPQLADRFVPHRRDITIPLAAITLPNHDLVALLWQNDAEGNGPAAIFASPDFLEADPPELQAVRPRSGADHLLGLFLPEVPEHVEPNHVIAATPVTLAAGQSLTIRAQLLARPHAQVLDAVETWRQVHAPAPAGDVDTLLPATLKLSRTAFEHVLWVDGQGWMSIPARKVASRDPSVALLYHWLAALLPDPKLRDLAEQRVPTTDDLPLALWQGNVASALATAAEAGRAPLASRRSSLDWGFDPDDQRAMLGRRGDTNVGIIAPPLATIFRSARAGADERMLAEAMKSLPAMLRYRVPRGAQVWEVPLHAPDILASSRACEVFCLAYELTGDEQWLQRARDLGRDLTAVHLPVAGRGRRARADARWQHPGLRGELLHDAVVRPAGAVERPGPGAEPRGAHPHRRRRRVAPDRRRPDRQRSAAADGRSEEPAHRSLPRQLEHAHRRAGLLAQPRAAAVRRARRRRPRAGRGLGLGAEPGQAGLDRLADAVARPERGRGDARTRHRGRARDVRPVVRDRLPPRPTLVRRHRRRG